MALMMRRRRGCLVLAVLLGLAALADVSQSEAGAALSPLETVGQALFDSPILSVPAGTACSACHDPKRAFTGNHHNDKPAIALGSRPGQFGTRNAPTIAYMSFSPPFSFVAEKNDKGETEFTPTGGQFWDGRADSLFDQVHGPLFNPVEMNGGDAAQVQIRLKASPLAAKLEAALGSDALATADKTMTSVATAIAAYESSAVFHPFNSKFDDYLRGKVQLSPLEARGFALFKDPEKGNCLSCHMGKVDSKDPQDWLFTDFTYDNLGLPRNAAIPANAAAGTFDLGLCARPGLEALLPKEVDKNALCGAFKVPTLRNVAVTAPYFHNGSFKNLQDVVRFYVTRSTNPEKWFPKVDGKAVPNDLPPEMLGNVNTSEAPYDRKPGEKPRLDESEINAVVAFLKTLTDAPFSSKAAP